MNPARTPTPSLVRIRRSIGIGLLTPALLLPASPIFGQNGTAAHPRPYLEGVRAGAQEPRIDGFLTEAVWGRAPVAKDFTQFEPDPGRPASQRTEARVLYGEDALYVALRAFDTAPDSIVAELARRDRDEYSDRVGVLIDGYLDRRTAFQFTVNPRGVKTDVRWYGDVEEDDRWDPIWEVATQVDAEGWTAEFRIPYSQLRFGDRATQSWGIQFHRDIARLDEVSVWARTLPEEGAVVSRFGELRSLEGLSRPTRLEVLPYAMSRTREGVSTYDPGARISDAALGVDVKYGLTSNFTLDLTVNPDFGQVEADPSRVNLTAFETFYPERRPFFQEAADLFDFRLSLGDGEGDLEMLFYSRRIGRQPIGFADRDRRFSSPTEQTTILGAAKVSGRTDGGWSLGLLTALTEEERAKAQDGGAGAALPVEPMTSHSVARIVKDMRNGRSAIGVMGTAVVREGRVADGLSIPSTAFTGGIDFRHRFAGDRYQLWGWILGSTVSGSESAMARIQSSPVHNFQRPGADHLTFDPTLTSLRGTAGMIRLHRIAGGPWRGGVGFQTRSPGFDAGDAGFQRLSDARIGYVEVGYERTEPQGPFRSWEVYTTHWDGRTTGGEKVEQGGNVRAEFTLRNLWGGWAGVEYVREGLSTSELRGGPGLVREGEVFGWAGVFTDARRRITGRVEGRWSLRPESDSWGWQVSPSLTWRPTAVAAFQAGSFFSARGEDRQWVGALGEEDPTYLVGRMKQLTLGATLRADMAFTPTLTLQLHAQPFVSAGTFHRFKAVTDPDADRYGDRFTEVALRTSEDGLVVGDVDGDGVQDSFHEPDFNFKQLRTNLVLRWEFRPGSTLYLVWSQGRESVVSDGSFRPGRDFRDLIGARSDDALMLKVSYWLSR